MSADVWCQRCMVILDDGVCPRCGIDRKVSVLTAEERRLMAAVIRGLAKSGRRK